MTSSNDSQKRFHVVTETYPYPIFDTSGAAILPCRREHCVAEDGGRYIPAPINCAHANCGKRFRPACPAVIYCSQKCFEATNTQDQWEESKPETTEERKKRLQKVRRTRYLATENGHKKRSEQNKRCYRRRKAAGKTHAAYERIKSRRLLIGTNESTKSVCVLELDSSISHVESEVKEPEKVLDSPYPQIPKSSQTDSDHTALLRIIEYEEEPPEETICRYPGCDKMIVHGRTYWGKDRKFCSREHREKMNLLFLRLKRVYKFTHCPVLRRVLRYLNLITGKPPPLKLLRHSRYTSLITSHGITKGDMPARYFCALLSAIVVATQEISQNNPLH